MRRWMLSTLVITLAIFVIVLSGVIPSIPASAAPQLELTPVTRDSIIARAKEIALGQWVSPVTVYADQSATPKRWGTFYAGQTYTGMAYTQQNPQESWLAFRTNMANKIGKPGVDQGTDCSGFLSFAWQIPRQTTWTFLPNGYAYRLSSLGSLLPGDGLLREYDHIGLFEGRLESGNLMMLDQTDPKARRGEWTYSYSSTYMPVRRYNVTDSTPTPPPPPAPFGTFSVQYFANETASGTPALTRQHAYPLSHNWGAGSPGSGVPSDGFSMRASGTFYFDIAGYYTFNIASDDGVRLWLDGKLIEDQWYPHAPTSFRDEHYVSAGNHTVKVEYFEKGGDALLELRWWRTRTCPSGQFLGEFFSNTYLGGAPSARTCDTTIDENWGTGSPDTGVPSDRFSARWEGKFGFQARPYTFIARADDGVRVWVDGALIIDQWKNQAPTEYRVTRKMTSGTHTVLVRYYENSGGALAQLRWE